MTINDYFIQIDGYEITLARLFESWNKTTNMTESTVIRWYTDYKQRHPILEDDLNLDSIMSQRDGMGNQFFLAIHLIEIGLKIGSIKKTDNIINIIDLTTLSENIEDDDIVHEILFDLCLKVFK